MWQWGWQAWSTLFAGFSLVGLALAAFVKILVENRDMRRDMESALKKLNGTPDTLTLLIDLMAEHFKVQSYSPTPEDSRRAAGEMYEQLRELPRARH